MNGAALSDLCTLVTQQVDPQSSPGDLYVGLEHIASGRLTRESGGLAGDVQSSKYRFHTNDVLYGKLRPYLDKSVLADTDGVCTTELLVLRPKPEVDARYLAALVHSPQFIEHAVSGTTGSQHPRTSWHHIADFPVCRLEPTEQVRFAELVWSNHRALRASEAALACAQEIKAAAMRELFTRGLRDEAQKESEIGAMPVSWSVDRLDLRAEIISSRMTYSELENLDSTEEVANIKVIGIKVGDMNRPGNEVMLGTAALQRLLPLSVAQRRCAPPGTIVFPKRGAAIATNKKRMTGEWSAFDPNVIGIIASDGLEQGFLFQWFQGFDLRTITEPGPTPQLNKKNLEPLLIPVPPTSDEQQEITAILDAIDAKIDLHKRKKAVLEELLRALLHRLMTGEIRVADLDLAALEANQEVAA